MEIVLAALVAAAVAVSVALLAAAAAQPRSRSPARPPAPEPREAAPSGAPSAGRAERDRGRAARAAQRAGPARGAPARQGGLDRAARARSWTIASARSTDRQRNVEHAREELKAAKRDQVRELERVAGLSAGQAKQIMMRELEDELRHESARLMPPGGGGDPPRRRPHAPAASSPL